MIKGIFITVACWLFLIIMIQIYFETVKMNCYRACQTAMKDASIVPDGENLKIVFDEKMNIVLRERNTQGEK